MEPSDCLRAHEDQGNLFPTRLSNSLTSAATCLLIASLVDSVKVPYLLFPWLLLEWWLLVALMVQRSPPMKSMMSSRTLCMCIFMDSMGMTRIRSRGTTERRFLSAAPWYVTVASNPDNRPAF